MASNWRSYYKRKYRKYYKKKYGGSSYSKRSYGQMKAAKQQADQAAFVMNIPTNISCKCVQGTMTNGRTVEVGTFPLNIYDLLRKSEFYQSYANMYDEFKIDNVKVKLIPTKYNVTVGSTNNAGYQSFTVYTAWDRTGLNSKQLLLNTSGLYDDQPISSASPNGPKNKDYIGKQTDNDGLYCIVGTDITTYSSAESRQVSIGQNCSITRWLKPKTLSEKSQWLSTAQLKSWYGQYNDADAAFKYIPTYDNSSLDQISNMTVLSDRSVATILSSVSPAISSNPCFLEEDPTVSFKPTLLVGLYPADIETIDVPRTVYFNVEAEVSCSFRGLRRSKVVSTVGDSNYGTSTGTLVINKNFIRQDNGEVNVNGVNVEENIHLEDGQMNVEVPIGEVQQGAPDRAAFRSLVNRNSLIKGGMEIDEADRDALRAWWNPIDWVCWVEDKVESGVNTVFDTVTSFFGVPKYDAEYYLLTKSGQIAQHELSTIIQAITQGLFTRISNTTVGEEAVHATTFAYYWLDEDSLRRKIQSWDDQRESVSRETRDIAALLLPILERVGGIVINKVKECVTLQAGGRYNLDETGYWFFKHGDDTILILNEYAENYDQDKVQVDLHQGDCYFWFGAEADLTSVGLNEYRFSCCFDKDYNICFNTPFGDWTIATRALIEGAVNKVIDWGKCAFQKIGEAIWNFFSYFVGDRSYLPGSRTPQTILYPGLSLVHPIIGETSEEKRTSAAPLNPPFQFNVY